MELELAFKNIEDNFPDFGTRCNTDNIKNKNIIENKIKIVNHDHCLEKIILLVIFVESVIYI